MVGPATTHSGVGGLRTCISLFEIDAMGMSILENAGAWRPPTIMIP